jgi:CheY-like chemotaxis protein
MLAAHALPQKTCACINAQFVNLEFLHKIQLFGTEFTQAGPLAQRALLARRYVIVCPIISNNHAKPREDPHTRPIVRKRQECRNQKRPAYVFFKCRSLQFIRQEKVPMAPGGPIIVLAQSVLSGKRCLVLDDEFLIALDIQQILERAGATQVVCVASAAEARDFLRRETKFDIAVLDVKLSGPELNSLGVAEMLAEEGTPFVFLTGMRVDDVHAKRFPEAPVIEKPYDAIALLDAVRRALEPG